MEPSGTQDDCQTSGTVPEIPGQSEPMKPLSERVDVRDSYYGRHNVRSCTCSFTQREVFKTASAVSGGLSAAF